MTKISKKTNPYMILKKEHSHFINLIQEVNELKKIISSILEKLK